MSGAERRGREEAGEWGGKKKKEGEGGGQGYWAVSLEAAGHVSDPSLPPPSSHSLSRPLHLIIQGAADEHVDINGGHKPGLDLAGKG